ncbi:hypothetical protein LINPERHAP1_LOCUS41519, partial [Linum perenne]
MEGRKIWDRVLIGSSLGALRRYEYSIQWPIGSEGTTGRIGDAGLYSYHPRCKKLKNYASLFR